MEITRRDLDDAHRYATEALRGMRDPAPTSHFDKGIVGHLIQTLEVGAGAAVVGVLTGRFGALDFHFQGKAIPMDLASALAGHLVAFSPLAGRYSEHLHNVSDGALAAYLTRLGVGLGTTMRRDAGLAPIHNTRIAGDVARPSLSRRASDAELLNLSLGPAKRAA